MWFIDFYPESEKQDGRMGSGRLCAARSSPWVHGRLGAAAGCGRPAPQCDRATQIARLGKDPNSQLNVHFLLNTYHFYTIVKLKMVALKHHKLGFLSIYILITCFQVYASSQSPPPRPPTLYAEQNLGPNSLLLVTLPGLLQVAQKTAN